VAKYGDHEDLSRALDEVRRLNAETDDLNAKEETRRRLTQGTAASEEAAAAATKRLADARREAAQVARRAQDVANVEARALDSSTQAIERNARARQQAARLQQQAAAMQRGALQGARDPLFAQAAALGAGGAPPSQYALRRQLAVGQQRAARLQAASVAGFVPQVEPRQARFPATRRLAAELEVERAESQLTQATRELTNARRRKSATDEERAIALEQRETARQQREAARKELESATRAEEQSRQRTQEEAARRAREASRQPGTDIIPHPTEFGRRVPGPFGPVVQQRGVVAEGGAMGAGRAPGGQVRGGVQAQTQELNEYLRALDDVQRAQVRATNARMDAYYSRLDAETARVSANTRQSAVSFGMASQAMTRHGALSSEFIAAAARGETSVREIGNQALITAGKFAGWVGVGAGLYAVADAARAIGTGAIEAQSGVEQLSRVVNITDREAASAGFAELSDTFNVDIEVAADAVYRMGQVFHDQEDAARGAEAALAAYVAGGMDVEAATSGLISITQTWGLTSEDLLGVFDQINEAQNRFGATIPDIVAGMAKASGSYQQAGGDLDYMLALMVAIQRATRRTGQEIGTGLARGVNMFNRPVSVERLQAQGVTVDPENFQATIQSAMEAARRPGADINEIARGLMGNEYARLLAPVLADQENLNRAIKETNSNAQNVDGSAMREVEKVLRQANQQIVAIGTNLQQVGEALARAHAFDVLYVGLRALNGMLDLATGLLNIFNSLPDPLRQMVMYFGQGYVLLQAMRRLGATDALAGGPMGFLANPERRLQTFAQRGLRDAEQAARDELERARRTEVSRAIERDTAQQHLVGFRPEYERARALPEGHPEQLEAQARYNRLTANAAAAEARLDEARAASVGRLAVLRRTEEDLTAVRSLRPGQVRGYLERAQIPVPDEVARPSSGGTSVITRGGQDFEVGGRTSRVRALARESREWSDRTRRFVGSMQYGMAAMATAGGRIDRSARPLGRTSSALYTAGMRTATSLGNAASFMGRAGQSLNTIPGRMRSFASSLGVLDAALIAILVGSVVDDAIDGMEEGLGELESAAGRSQNSQRRMDDIQRQAREAAEVGAINMQDFLSRLNDLANPVELFGSTLPEIFRGQYETPTQRRHRVTEEAQDAAQNVELRRRLQARAAARGTARPQLNTDELMRDVERTAELRRNNIISQREFDRRMALHAIEAKTLYEPSRADVARAQAALADANRGAGATPGFREALKALPQEALQSQFEALTGTMEAFGPGADLERLRAVYGEAIARWSNTDDTEKIQALNQMRQAYFRSIETTMRSELEAGLASANTERERRAAYTRAQSFVRRNITENARNRLREARSQLRPAERELEGMEDSAGQLGLSDRPVIRSDLKKARDRVARLRRVERRSLRELRAAEREAERLQTELRRSAFEDREAGRDITLQLRQAQTPDERDRARLAVERAQAGVADASRFGRKSREYRQALTRLFQARDEAAQAAMGQIQAENALLMAQAGTDPVARARAGVTAARRVLAQMRGRNRAQYSDAERIQARADLITAEQEADQAVEERATRLADLQGQIAVARADGDPVRAARVAIQNARRAMATADNPEERAEALLASIEANNELESALADREDARMRMLASRTDDPVAQARVERVSAQRAVRRARPGTTAWYEARTRLNEARRGEVQAQLDSTTDDIEFEREMGNISIQDAISRYQTLLDSRNWSKEQRRAILRRIKGLQDEAEGEAGSFNLDVGSLKLPTAYDVRRAFDPVREQVRRQVRRASESVAGRDGRIAADAGMGMARAGVANMYDQRAQMNAQVNVYVSDRNAVGEVYEALDRVLGTSVRAKARSAGRRGS
jgi:TP901 family phage tail tape measure protein